MSNDRATTPPHLSRRHAVRLGMGMATALALGRSVAYGFGAANGAKEILIDAGNLALIRDNPNSILVGFMPEQDFANAHIPGSVQLDWPELELADTSDDAIAQWRDQMSHTLADLGITPNHPVVSYDAGTLFAARLWWVLHYLGFEDNYVLDGGLTAWEQVADDAATRSNPAAATASPAPETLQVVPRANTLAPLDEVLSSLDDPGITIIDARTPEEYAAGHIPGAVNINYPLNAVAGTPRFWKPVDELQAMYDAAGVSRDKRNIPYCSSGVRSAVTFLTLRHIGYEDVGLFTGSWNEWEQHPDTPKTTGDQP